MQSAHRSRADLRLTTSRLATPPPAPLRKYPEGIGWIDAQTIGFRGFENEQDAARAAAVAHRAMEARLSGGRAFTVAGADVPVTVSQRGDAEFVDIDDRPIARLVRLGSMQEGAAGSVAFELEVPVPVSTPALRDIASYVHHEMERVGVIRDRGSPVHAGVAPSRDDSMIDRWMKNRMLGIIVILGAALTMFAIAGALPMVRASRDLPILVAIAAGVAVAAFVTLVDRTLRDLKLSESRIPARD